jgi:hypothetical protein
MLVVDKRVRNLNLPFVGGNFTSRVTRHSKKYHADDVVNEKAQVSVHVWCCVERQLNQEHSIFQR